MLGRISDASSDCSLTLNEIFLHRIDHELDLYCKWFRFRLGCRIISAIYSTKAFGNTLEWEPRSHWYRWNTAVFFRFGLGCSSEKSKLISLEYSLRCMTTDLVRYSLARASFTSWSRSKFNVSLWELSTVTPMSSSRKCEKIDNNFTKLLLVVLRFEKWIRKDVQN